MLTIEAVAKTTGIPAFSLRNWEKRFGFPRPHRNNRGIRVYSEEQVSTLIQVKNLLDRGEKLNQAMELVVNDALEEYEAKDPVLVNQSVVEALYYELSRFKGKNAIKLHEELAASFSAYQMLDHVYIPMLKLVGLDWENGRISIAQEHYVTAFIRLHLFGILSQGVRRQGPLNRREIILATTSNELHEGGILTIAASLCLRGFRVCYLGTNLPVDELHAVCGRIKPLCVLLSFSLKDNFMQVKKGIKGLDIPVFIGGAGLEGVRVNLPDHIQIYRGDLPSFLNLIDRMSDKKKAT